MAIDTAQKRRSAASFKPIIKTPLPSGTVDRREASWLYAGISIMVGGLPLIEYITDKNIEEYTGRTMEEFAGRVLDEIAGRDVSSVGGKSVERYRT